MKAHKYAEIFPMLDDHGLAELAKDIEANGLAEPILTYDGQILDGRNRYKACQLAKVQPRFVPADCDSDEEALSLVMSLNLHRRHLNESQRAIVGARVLPMYEAIAAERRRVEGELARQRQLASKATPTTEPPKYGSGVGTNLSQPQNTERAPRARQYAAQAVNVSQVSVQHAKKVVEEAEPEVVQAVESGKLAVSAAAKLVKEDPEIQRRVVDAVVTGNASNAQQAIRRVRDEDRAERARVADATAKSQGVKLVQLVHGDAVGQTMALAEPVHLVVTDPPYGISTHRTRAGGMDYEDGEDAAIPLFRELCEALVTKLHPSAHLYVFAGYSHVHTFKAILGEFFDVQDNPLIWVKDNHTMADFSRKYPNKHEYILFARVKGSERRLARCVPDVLMFGREKTTTHSAQKPTELLSLLIEQSSEPGELVFDPFAGSGSTGVAAGKLKRRCIMVEKDDKWHGVAKGRLHDENL
jgi:DNA modification methylase